MWVVQISAMGDPEGNAKGGFVILDQDLKVQSTHLGLFFLALSLTFAEWFLSLCVYKGCLLSPWPLHAQSCQLPVALSALIVIELSVL